MDFITITAPTYEEAINKARREYGDRLRIHSRREVSKSSNLGFTKVTECELRCFLAEEVQFDNAVLYAEEPKTSSFVKEPILKTEIEPVQDTEKEQDNPQASAEVEFFLGLAEDILRRNDFSISYVKWCKDELREILVSGEKKFTEKEFELLLLDTIAESVNISHNLQASPKRITVLLGTSGSGKTTTIAKLAAMYSNASVPMKRNVRIVSLDDNPVAVQQLQNLGDTFLIDVNVATHESELENALEQRLGNELVLVDVVGKPIDFREPDYRLYGLMNVADQNSTDFLITIPAIMKSADIAMVFELYKSFDISGAVISKLDETCTIGNVISICKDWNVPLLYATDGKIVPKDIKKISIDYLLGKLKGFRVDLNRVFEAEKY